MSMYQLARLSPTSPDALVDIHSIIREAKNDLLTKCQREGYLFDLSTLSVDQCRRPDLSGNPVEVVLQIHAWKARAP